MFSIYYFSFSVFFIVGDSISSTDLPEAKLGQGYTEYMSFQDTGFNTDDDIDDDDILFDSLRSQLYGNDSHDQDRKSFTLPAGSLLPSGESFEGSPRVKSQRRRSLDTTSSSTLTRGSLHSLRSKEEVDGSWQSPSGQL